MEPNFARRLESQQSSKRPHTRSTSAQHCPSALARYLGAARYCTVAGGGTLGLTSARVVPVYRCPN
eukprot:7381278-Prymnesium_polylepis.1